MRATVPTRPATSVKASVTVPASMVGAVEQAWALEPGSLSVFEIEDGGRWSVELISADRPNTANLATALALAAASAGEAAPDLELEVLPAVDWLAQSYAAFPPIAVDRFWIHGTHVDHRPPASTVPITVDAATAFGSGEHPTTAGCLAAMARLAKAWSPRHILDVGCGTGILAFAACKVWRRPVLATDIDPEAVRVTRFNARINGLGQQVESCVSPGYAYRRIAERGPYDLIVSNILAGPLTRMAPDLARHLAPGGYAILAGLLTHQKRQVLHAHQSQGLVLVGHVQRGAWPTLIVRRP